MLTHTQTGNSAGKCGQNVGTAPGSLVPVPRLPRHRRQRLPLIGVVGLADQPVGVTGPSHSAGMAQYGSVTRGSFKLSASTLCGQVNLRTPRLDWPHLSETSRARPS
jgi:hypothetical protein